MSELAASANSSLSRLSHVVRRLADNGLVIKRVGADDGQGERGRAHEGGNEAGRRRGPVARREGANWWWNRSTKAALIRLGRAAEPPMTDRIAESGSLHQPHRLCMVRAWSDCRSAATNYSSAAHRDRSRPECTANASIALRTALHLPHDRATSSPSSTRAQPPCRPPSTTPPAGCRTKAAATLIDQAVVNLVADCCMFAAYACSFIGDVLHPLDMVMCVGGLPARVRLGSAWRQSVRAPRYPLLTTMKAPTPSSRAIRAQRLGSLVRVDVEQTGDLTGIAASGPRGVVDDGVSSREAAGFHALEALAAEPSAWRPTRSSIFDL